MTFSTLSDKKPTTAKDNSSISSVCAGTKDERLEFRASGGLLRILDELKTKYRINMSESIRRGVALYSIAVKETRKGSRLVFMRNNEIVGQIDDI